ncbi:MAG: cytochrome c [Sedimentitalea sp.]
MKLLTLPIVAALAIASPVFAADLDKGKKLSRQCTVCHGRDGVGTDPEVPNLAGQSAYYLEKAMKDYRSGEREDRRMTLIAKRLSDEDIRDLSAWYEAHVITVQPPS